MLAKTTLPASEAIPVARPANPTVRRTNIMIDPALKSRAARRAAAQGTSLHKVIEAALRDYLKRSPAP